jgi:hypothetical protein
MLVPGFLLVWEDVEIYKIQLGLMLMFSLLPSSFPVANLLLSLQSMETAPVIRDKAWLHLPVSLLFLILLAILW